MKVAELIIENIDTRDKTVYKNLEYDILENMYFRLNIDSLEVGNVFKIYRDFENKDARIYFAYPLQTLDNLKCLTIDDYFEENFKNTLDFKYRCDMAYLKKIIKDKIKYTIKIYYI